MSLRPGGEAKLNFLDGSMETLSGAVAVVTKAFNDVNDTKLLMNIFALAVKEIAVKGNKNALGEKKNKEERTNRKRKVAAKTDRKCVERISW